MIDSSDLNQLFIKPQKDFFRSFFQIVGHSEEEIEQMLPVLQIQFISTLLFAMIAQLEDPESAEPILAEVKQGNFEAMTQITKQLAPEVWAACYQYAITDVYGKYYQELVPSLDEGQATKLRELLTSFENEGLEV